MTQSIAHVKVGPHVFGHRICIDRPHETSTEGAPAPAAPAAVATTTTTTTTKTNRRREPRQTTTKHTTCKPNTLFSWSAR